MQDFDPRGHIIDDESAFRPQRPTLFAANAMYMFSIIALVLIGFCSSLVRSLFPSVLISDEGAQIIYMLVFLAAPTIIYMLRHEGVDISMRLSPPGIADVLFAITAAIIAVGLADSISTLWAVLLERVTGQWVDTGIQVFNNKADLVTALFVMGLLPGICEELLFRGAIMSAWERRGRRSGLVASSLLFALMHGSISGLPVHVMLGFVLGFLVIYTNSIYTAMIFHMVYNCVVLIETYMKTQHATSGVIYTSIYAAIGGMAGVLETAMAGAMRAILFASVLFVIFGRSRIKRPAIRREKMQAIPPGAMLVLCSGIVTALALYLLDLLRIYGVIV